MTVVTCVDVIVGTYSARCAACATGTQLIERRHLRGVRDVFEGFEYLDQAQRRGGGLRAERALLPVARAAIEAGLHLFCETVPDRFKLCALVAVGDGFAEIVHARPPAMTSARTSGDTRTVRDSGGTTRARDSSGTCRRRDSSATCSVLDSAAMTYTRGPVGRPSPDPAKTGAGAVTCRVAVTFAATVT
jgi:hypothetical protein